MFSDEVQSTIMTILNQATGFDESLRRTAMERFCLTYAQPLVAFLQTTKRISEEEAHEVVQGFFSDRLFGKDASAPFIEVFLKKKAKIPQLSFRRYLAKSVTFHFLSMKRKHSRENTVEDFDLVLDAQTAQSTEDEDVFDLAWANHLILRVLESVRLDCVKHGQLDLWQLFELHVLRPATTGQPSPGYVELANRLKLTDPKQAANRLQTVIRKFRRQTEQAVADYLPSHHAGQSQEEAILEINKVLEVLSKPGCLRIRAQQDAQSMYSCAYGVDEKYNQTAKLNDAFFRHHHLFVATNDLKLAWEHLLLLPLKTWLFQNGQVSESLCMSNLLDPSFDDIDTCDRVRSRAKQLGTQVNEDAADLPLEFLMVAYLLAIAVAKVRTGQNISTQPLETLKSKFEQVMNAPWIDPSSHALFQQIVV